MERTPLHIGCWNCHLPIVEYLISKGANINAKTKRGDYVIHYASKSGHLPTVQYLIEQQNVDIDIKGDDDKTPLHYACEHDHLPIVKYLVSKGANKYAKDMIGRIPYDLAWNDEIRNILK